tara:strand:- start:611 stop:1306 length:696 start_codon:yes stop_codon:yes gene_type:complete
VTQKSTILIIEDDARNREQLRKALSKYSCHFISDYNDGFEQAKAISPDLIILDLELPLRNGFIFLEKRASDVVLSKIPVIVSVDHKDEIRQLRGTVLGAVSFLKKPYEKQVVAAQVSKFLKEPSFKCFKFSESQNREVTVKTTGWVKLLSEAAFVLESPVKIKMETPVTVDCPVFKELEISDVFMKTTHRPPYQVSTGVFSDEVVFVGMDEENALKIKRLIRHWGARKWNL